MIKRVCDSQGRKYSWLAKRLGMSLSHFDNILRGFRTAPPDFYERAATILGVPVELIRPAESVEITA